MLISLAILSGCATPAPTPATSVPPFAGCTAFPRISYSRQHDTDETIRQVKAYLAARDAVCGVGR